ncbi:TraB/GumN family protein [Dyella japonica]|uniref:Polysaccharide biosynthesis protein GumN n=1 Tax=Dyella japonica A8 TaxID=1217721 RepID=A0A075JYS1_9GAMM|nr:TraB/GumN family protein [Dyella japonica]AIF46587.1 polysaccharide biosynthesis protein GumN [Dyella japonica A8]
MTVKVTNRLARPLSLVLATGLLATAGLSLAQNAPAPASTAPGQVQNLEAVSVSGVQPGPGLWRVSKGDHVMWVLGTLSPLPDRIQWKTDEVEQTIADSQEVLGPPSVALKAKAGFFGKLFLLPSLIGARKNPDGQTLQQMVPAPDYARWLVLKQQYIGSDRGIESWRPIFAAVELYDKAIKRYGLTSSGGVKDTVRELAKKHNVNINSVRYTMVVEEPRSAVKTFKSSPMDDRECFGRTLDTVERDMGRITERANAWATGDIDLLRSLPMNDQREACLSAVTEAGFAKQLGFSDVKQKSEAMWITEAERALNANKQTFAMLPMQDVLSPKGLLARLKAQGYQVEAPDGSDAEGQATTQP